ncbi:hypothetical protein TNCV_3773411 [Trichonephila clavipes]|nr:hypothetical protein TNCV_3773411 [Trichonephila clavipes]
MPPDLWYSQIEDHETDRGKMLVLHLSLASTLSTIQAKINIEVNSVLVQELLDSHIQKLLIDELIEMHEQQDVQELETVAV